MQHNYAAQNTTIQYAAHRTEHREQHKQSYTTSTHSYSYIVLIFMMNTYISKNSIIQLYTHYIQTIYILLALLMR